MGSQLVRAFPALRSLEWAELPGTEQVWATIAAATNLHSQLSQLCLGVAFGGGDDADEQQDDDEFRLPSLAALTQLQELVVAHAGTDYSYDFEGGFGTLLLPAGRWLPPSLRHLHLAAGRVLLLSTEQAQMRRHRPRYQPLSLAGVEASLETLVVVTVSWHITWLGSVVALGTCKGGVLALCRCRACAWQQHAWLFWLPAPGHMPAFLAGQGVQDAPHATTGTLNRSLFNLLEGLPALPALRALGIVIPGNSLIDLWTRPGLRAPDLLNKLPALTPCSFLRIR
jgi:hypothetical protein